MKVTEPPGMSAAPLTTTEKVTDWLTGAGFALEVRPIATLELSTVSINPADVLGAKALRAGGNRAGLPGWDLRR